MSYKGNASQTFIIFFLLILLLESDKPGIVVAQLETTDGKVLGSTKFLYKEEISTGFQKIVCSKNYGGKLIMGLSDFGAKEDQAMANESEANQGKDLLYPIGDQSDISPYNIQYKIKQTGDENREKYKLVGY